MERVRRESEMSEDKKPPSVEERAGSPLAPAAASSGPPSRVSTSAEVAEFVSTMKALAPKTAGPRGRLIFAMDATMSREPTWDMALALQGEMFRVVKDVGGLDVQLMYFRGASEARASRWVSNPEALDRLMRAVSCQGGYTQIAKVLSHAKSEAAKAKVNALVYVGDAMEENVDDLAGRAGEVALLGVPVFLFQEGSDPDATAAFKELARLTKGAHCRFGSGSARELRELLTAVAVYAAGGQKALTALLGRTGGEGAKLLLAAMKR